MSFKINWPEFSDEFLDQAKSQLTVALNNGGMPDNIVGRIEVKELDMGTKPPDLEILEIGELAEDRFKGIFKLGYSGDAFILIKTKVQANPLTTPLRQRTLNARNTMLAAQQPFVVPMEIRISNVKLRGIIVLVVDKERGITLVFKNDPLERVDVNSTFDNIPNIRKFLQTQIEAQLRNLFQNDLPQMVHNLSLVVLNQQAADTAKAKAEAKLSRSYGSRSSRASEQGYDDRQEYQSKVNGVAGNPPMYYDPSAYELESMDRYAQDRTHLNKNYADIRQQHDSSFRRNGPYTSQQKWSGNESVEKDGYTLDQESENEGYVLYRSLSQTGIPEAAELGLTHVFLQEAQQKSEGGIATLPTRNAKVQSPKRSSLLVDIPTSQSQSSVSAAMSGFTISSSIDGRVTPNLASNVQFHYPPHLAAGSITNVGLSSEYHRMAIYGGSLFSPPSSTTPGLRFTAHPIFPKQATDQMSNAEESRQNEQSQQGTSSKLHDGSRIPSVSVFKTQSRRNHESSVIIDHSLSNTDDALSVQSSPAVFAEGTHMYRKGQVQHGTVWHRPIQEPDRQFLAPPQQRLPHSNRHGHHDTSRHRQNSKNRHETPMVSPQRGDESVQPLQGNLSQRTYNQNGQRLRNSKDFMPNTGGSQTRYRSRENSVTSIASMPLSSRQGKYASPDRSEFGHGQHHRNRQNSDFDQDAGGSAQSLCEHEVHPSHSETPHHVVLQPSDNEVAAHLANLMNSNHTISPYTHDLEHYTYRAATSTSFNGATNTIPHRGQNGVSPCNSFAALPQQDGLETRSMSGLSVTSHGFSYSGSRHVKRRAIARTVRTIRIPSDITVPGLSSRSGSLVRGGGIGRSNADTNPNHDNTEGHSNGGSIK
ncbi:hypothetical protein BDV3_000816 [Batrachochytrium dendrobatidis]